MIPRALHYMTYDYSLDENARLGSRRARGRGRRTNVVGDDGTVLTVVQEDALAVSEEAGKLAEEAVDSLPTIAQPLIAAVPPADASSIHNRTFNYKDFDDVFNEDRDISTLKPIEIKYILLLLFYIFFFCTSNI